MTPRIRVKKPCPIAGCPNIVERGLCPEHDHGDRHDSRWRRIRAAILAEHPRCACGEPARMVDHILPLNYGGTHDRANLRQSCWPCHKRKTQAEDVSMRPRW